MSDGGSARGRVLVAVPAFNESATVASVVAAVRRELPEAGIVVVDDGSRDDTANAASLAGAAVLEMPFNVGVGGAMRAAFLYAWQEDFDAVVQVDADGQHPAEEIPKLLAALAHASVVVGSRFNESSEYPVRGPRKWAMKTLSFTLTRITGSQLTDTTSGFRAADRRAIRLFSRHYPVEYLGDTVESLVIASRAGLPIAQVPVQMRVRQGGTPSQNPFKSFLYLGRAMLALIVALSSTASFD